jgi:transposase
LVLAGCRSFRVDDLLNRHDLTAEEWERLVPLMPAHPRQGHRWNDHRMVINGIFFHTRTGCPWRDLPPGFGNWSTVYGRHRRWSLDGTWAQILAALRAGCDRAEGADWTVSADSTVVRAHQHAAGARRAGGLPAAAACLANQVCHWVYSRGHCLGLGYQLAARRARRR